MTLQFNPDKNFNQKVIEKVPLTNYPKFAPSQPSAIHTSVTWKSDISGCENLVSAMVVPVPTIAVSMVEPGFFFF